MQVTPERNDPNCSAQGADWGWGEGRRWKEQGTIGWEPASTALTWHLLDSNSVDTST